jgi:hypothetical protein
MFANGRPKTEFISFPLIAVGKGMLLMRYVFAGVSKKLFIAIFGFTCLL